MHTFDTFLPKVDIALAITLAAGLSLLLGLGIAFTQIHAEAANILESKSLETDMLAKTIRDRAGNVYDTQWYSYALTDGNDFIIEASR